MNPPTVYEVTMPRSHRTTRIIAIVVSMVCFDYAYKADNRGYEVYDVHAARILRAHYVRITPSRS